jgi:hypothetical protein
MKAGPAFEKLNSFYDDFLNRLRSATNNPAPVMLNAIVVGSGT